MNMCPASELVVVSTSPIIARAMEYWLESAPYPFRCRTLDPTDSPSEPTTEPAALVIAPQHWREMAQWLPCLREHFERQAWLVFADLRVAGMFTPTLERQLCTLVAPGASPEELRIALGALSRGHAILPPSALLGLISQGAPLLPDGEKVTITPKEAQCGCAVSLGLTNPQISEALCLGGGTVKTHIYHLMRKLQLPSRIALEKYIERALTPFSLPP